MYSKAPCTLATQSRPKQKMETKFLQWPFQDPKLEVPTIYKAYFSGLCKRIYTPKIWPEIVKQGDGTETQKEEPQSGKPCIRKKTNALLFTGTLSHGVSSVLSYPLTLVVVRVRGKYLLLPMTTLHV